VVGNQRVPLSKDDRGVWSGTSDVLKPDVYMYQSRWSDQPHRRLARITLRVGETSGAEPHTKGVGRSCLKYAL
jgi:hypothetical protein